MKTLKELGFWYWKTYMYARLLGVKCQDYAKATQFQVKWARQFSHFTLMFKACTIRFMTKVPANATVRELREHDNWL
ncbi:hypothetical protein [Paenibacillus polymyxa]|uniref:hypothetical protein n=1 Tax=Paenibacillus polymyxa TaxID=1406 RepID=UPI0004B48066|nr:hypothetical protein [Paenibacillus polymyxa]